MFENYLKPRQVCITGFGCVTPIGVGRVAFWKSLGEGASGVSLIEGFDTSDSNVKIAAEIKDFEWQAELNPKDRKHVPRTVPLALASAREAVRDACIDTDRLSLEFKTDLGIDDPLQGVQAEYQLLDNALLKASQLTDGSFNFNFTLRWRKF